MADNPQARYQALLAQLSQQLRTSPQLALQNLDKLLARSAGDPNFLHLKGLALAALDRHADAVSAMEASLRVFPQQSECHGNLANSLKKLERLDEAEQHYREALAINPAFLEASKNLGLLLLSMERLEEAREALAKVNQRQPEDASVLTALGNVERLSHGYGSAIHYYRQALAAQPNYTSALHNLGLALKLNEQAADALPYFKRADELAPTLAEVQLNWGNAHFELGDYEAARHHYEAALARDPGYVLAHETISELLWQLGDTTHFTDAYGEAINALPDNIPLRESLVQVLINAGQFDRAAQALGEAMSIQASPALLRASAELAANRADYAQARRDFEAALQQSPDTDTAHGLARLLIIEGDYPAALSVLDTLQSTDPDNQLTWALKGTCWRLLDDPRYQWLIDYQRDVRVLTLDTPPGYASLPEFLEALQAVLLGMHGTRAAPMRQTLVSGTQTPGRLLHKPDPVIQVYRELLTRAVSRYIEDMPTDPTHPLYARRSKNFTFSGSWSVRLYSGGYHVNHVHPEGWISSACYIHLPSGMGSESNAGCIKFGESALGLGEREVVERIVRPEPGQLALFPSYVWHGTYDFDAPDTDYRLTAPFDVIPQP